MASALRCRRKFLMRALLADGASRARRFAEGLYDFLYGIGSDRRPEHHIFLKPMVTRRAAREYGFEFEYRSRPNWDT